MSEAPERIWARASDSAHTNEDFRAWRKPFDDKEIGYIRDDIVETRIKELEGKLAKAIHALRITDKWLVELGMYANPDYHLVPSLQHVRDTLKELDK